MRYGGTNWDGMRASDADRERAADVLKAALGEGRLDWNEHQRRLDQVMKARTYGELNRAISDLPQGPVPTVPAQITPPYPARPPWARPVPLPPPKEQLATVSMVLGLVSPFICGTTAIPAVITGHMALSRIKRDNLEGQSQAIVGLVMGYLFVSLGVLYMLLVILGFTLF